MNVMNVIGNYRIERSAMAADRRTKEGCKMIDLRSNNVSDNDIATILSEVYLVELLSFKFHEFGDLWSLGEVDVDLWTDLYQRHDLYLKALNTRDVPEIRKHALALRKVWRQAIAAMEEHVQNNLRIYAK